MQKKATKEEYELQVLIDAFPFYIMVLDEEHKILMANKAIRGDLGLNPTQIIGEYCPKTVHGLDEPYPGCPLEETLDKGHGVEREFHDPESNRWISSAVYPIKQWTQKNRKIFIHYIMDITETKQAEEEIKRNYDIQTVIDKVLHLSLEDISLDQLLKRTIDFILQIPWLALDEKGCIFLVTVVCY